MSKYGIGQPVLRFEDPRLLRGQGRYINDVNLPGQAYAIFVRSPHAHAKIRSIDVEAAKAAPGVLAAYTGHDVKADGLGMPKANMPRKRPDGKPMFAPQRPPLVTDRVRYVGDPVVMVIAETLAQAKDAAELVEIDYEPLPSVTLTEDTVKPGAPAVWDDCPDNISNHVERGKKADTEEAIKDCRQGRQAALRDHPRACPVHGAARHARHLRPGRGPADALRRRAVSPPRAQHAGAERLQGAREQDARDRAGRRRRLRHQGLAVYRASPDPVGGAQAAAAGQVDLRALRGGDGRRARPRQCRRDHAGARQGQQVRRAQARDAGQHRRLCRLRPQPAVAVRHDRHGAGRLPDPQGLHQRGGRAQQHQPDGALSRRGAAGSDLSHRTADRRCGARTGRRPGRAAAQEHAAGIGVALPEPGRAVLRLRRVREEHGHGAEARRRGGLRGAQGRVRRSAAGCAAWASSMRSSRRPARRSPNMPRSASIRAAPRRCSWAPRTRARATRRCSSRS